LTTEGCRVTIIAGSNKWIAWGEQKMTKRESMIQEIMDELNRHPEKIAIALEWMAKHKGECA
jgi:hypothetical protein